jgi:hypothetical protein
MNRQLAFDSLPKGVVPISNALEPPEPFQDNAIISSENQAWTEGFHGDADWSRAGGDLVIPDQPAIAVYWNPTGAVVIRQEGQYGPEEDHFVYVRLHNLPLLIAKLQAMAKEAG